MITRRAALCGGALRAGSNVDRSHVRANAGGANQSIS
jgi:hypothetical protein